MVPRANRAVTVSVESVQCARCSAQTRHYPSSRAGTSSTPAVPCRHYGPCLHGYTFAVAEPPGDETRERPMAASLVGENLLVFFFVANYSSTTQWENIKRVVWDSDTTPHVRKRKTANRITVTRHVLRITTYQILRLHPPEE